MDKITKKLEACAVGAILLFAVWLRVVGIDWDNGHLLNPDERFLFMVKEALAIPSSLADFFDTARSPMNPHNRGFSFFVYGTLPLFIVKVLSEVGELVGGWPPHLYGRVFSATCDIGTALLVYLVARQAFTPRIALLALFLVGSSVLHIQHSHFGVVDAPLTFFVTLSLSIASWIILRPCDSWKRVLVISVLFGCAAGCAAATKITGGLVTMVLPVALCVRSRSVRDFFLCSLSAGFVFLLTVRLFQPYAFTGPGGFGLMPNPRWIANLRELSSQAKPSVYFPPAVQWFDRGSFFGIKNLVIWGMGFVPGITAMVGLAVWWWRTIFKRDRRLIIFVVWASLGLIVFGLVPWVVSLRYLLPLYPALYLIAAGSMGTLLACTDGRPYLGSAARWFVAGVCACSCLWALAFVSIYRKPHTRIAASEWIMTNVMGAVELVGITSSGRVMLPVQIPQEGFITIDPGSSLNLPFSVHEKMQLVGIRIPMVKSNGTAVVQNTSSSPPTITISTAGSRECSRPTSIAEPVDGGGLFAPVSCTLRQGTQHSISITAPQSSEPLRFKKASIAHETSWDDGLPLRVIGYDPYPAVYTGKSNFEMYWKDDTSKLDRMVSILHEADYIFITSNRQWGSIGRVARYYPLTQRFYRRLLNCSEESSLFDCYAKAEAPRLGNLGFELVKTETSYPQMFGFEINDQYAEEAFSVYDHPKVMIFKRTNPLPEASIRAILADGEIEGEPAP